MQLINIQTLRQLQLWTLLGLAVWLTGCAATSQSSPRVSANVEIQESVGFTITEPGRVSTDHRGDYDEAQRLLEMGDTQQAITLLTTLAEAVPHLSAPRIDLGIAYHRAGDLALAEENLSKALASNPEHPIALNELGIVYRKLGRFADAKRQYQVALAIYPNYHYARRNLGVLCDLYLADLNCALENYEAYMNSVGEDAEAAVWIADIRQRIGQEE